jgi:hypothetical protein
VAAVAATGTAAATAAQAAEATQPAVKAVGAVMQYGKGFLVLTVKEVMASIFSNFLLPGYGQHTQTVFFESADRLLFAIFPNLQSCHFCQHFPLLPSLPLVVAPASAVTAANRMHLHQCHYLPCPITD